jgi:hypothetical protein
MHFGWRTANSKMSDCFTPPAESRSRLTAFGRFNLVTARQQTGPLTRCSLRLVQPKKNTVYSGRLLTSNRPAGNDRAIELNNSGAGTSQEGWLASALRILVAAGASHPSGLVLGAMITPSNHGAELFNCLSIGCRLLPNHVNRRNDRVRSRMRKLVARGG